MRNRLAAASLVAVSLLYSVTGRAASLAPGSSLSPVPLAVTSASSVAAAFGSEGFISSTLNGEWKTAVLTGDTDNPFGGLTFVYLFANGGTDDVARLSVDGFAGFLTDVGYDLSSQPNSISPGSIERDLSGNAIIATYSPNEIGPNSGFTSSNTVVIRTNAQFWAEAEASLEGASSTAIVQTFKPSVPEPSTLLLATLAGLGLLAYRARGLRAR